MAAKKKSPAKKKAPARKAAPKAAAKKRGAPKTAAPKKAVKKAATAKTPAKKQAAAKKPGVATPRSAAPKQMPAPKPARTTPPTAPKPAPTPSFEGGISPADVNLGHIAALRPRTHTGFRPEAFQEAKRVLADARYPTIEHAARAVAEKAVELSNQSGGHGHDPFSGH